MIKLDRIEDLSSNKDRLLYECNDLSHTFDLCMVRMKACEEMLTTHTKRIQEIDKEIEHIRSMNEQERERYDICFLKEQLEEKLAEVWSDFSEASSSLSQLIGDKHDGYIDNIIISRFDLCTPELAEEDRASIELIDSLKLRDELRNKGIKPYISRGYDKFEVTYE